MQFSDNHRSDCAQSLPGALDAKAAAYRCEAAAM
jgi:hypothetical protein